MRVMINNQSVPAFTPEQERLIRVADHTGPLSGSVLTAAEATARYLRRLYWVFGIVGSVAAVLLAGFGWIAAAKGFGVVIPIELLVAAAITAAIAWAIRWSRRIWRERLGARVAALPPAGAPVTLDDAGLWVGGVSAPWPSWRIETVELFQISDEHGTIYLVKRLWLTAPGARLTLDSELIRNGRAIADQAYHRLRPLG